MIKIIIAITYIIIVKNIKESGMLKMENKMICESNNGLYLKELQDMGYKYIVKGVDNFLSGWGGASGKKHLQLIACKTMDECTTIYHDLLNDISFSYVNWYYITDKKGIYNTIRNKSYTIRNDWRVK